MKLKGNINLDPKIKNMEIGVNCDCWHWMDSSPKHLIYILKNVGNQTVAVDLTLNIFFPYYASQWGPSTVWLSTFFRIYFVQKKKKMIIIIFRWTVPLKQNTTSKKLFHALVNFEILVYLFIMWLPIIYNVLFQNIYSGYGKYSDPLKFFTLCYIAAIC